jgi:UDP-N-acetylmuramate: L-alanyl-gamma-D-glutamyl-meso-diaminopimelate ligase
MEAILDSGERYVSGPQWFADHVLMGKHVLAVSGTHGKTTTTAMLTWILERAGLAPGFLIGGVPADFPVSARLTAKPCFVIEADEYDTAFFDKRSKFIHYRPRTAILNNIEFDHADIFDDLESIERQFHHFVRTVPKSGKVVANGADESVKRVLAMGCWTPVDAFGGGRGMAGGRGRRCRQLRGCAGREAFRPGSMVAARRAQPDECLGGASRRPPRRGSSLRPASRRSRVSAAYAGACRSAGRRGE